MPEVNTTVPVARPDLSASMSRANNLDFNLFSASNYMMSQPPQYFVYLYNISSQEFSVSRPPVMREVKIPACKEGQKYALVTRIPQPLLIPKGNVDSNDVEVIPTDARRFAMDIIHPENITIDQDAVLDPANIFSQGTNLGAKGVFWSLNGPGATKYGAQEQPTQAELDAAYKRLEKHYDKILKEATAVELSNPATLNAFLTPDHHAAAAYSAKHFGIEYKWSGGKKARFVDCQICGERMRENAAFHKTEDGSLCINNWSVAVAAGVRTRAQAYEATGDEKFAPKTPAKVPTNVPTEE